MSKTKLLAAAVLTATLAVGVGRQAPPTADAQTPGPTPGAQGSPPDGGGSPGPGGDGSPRPKGATPKSAGGGLMGMMGGSAGRGPRVEYHFVPKPKGADAFKKLLGEQGRDGWEYVGPVPGDDELIFKRTARPGGVTTGGMMGPGGMPGGSGFGGFSGGPGGLGGGPGPGGFGGGSGLGRFGSTIPGGTPGTPAPKGGTGGRGSEGSPSGDATNPFGGGPGAGGGGPGASTNLTIREGETIRHKMKTNQTIDRVHSDNPKAVEVTLDPTDARRVLIRALNQSGARVELTDEKGTREQYTVWVR